MGQPIPLPDNLPDNRTAQRLVDVLAHLELALRNSSATQAAAAPAPAAPEDSAKLQSLKDENRRLRTRHQQASQRLDALIARLQAQQEEAEKPDAEPQPEESAA